MVETWVVVSGGSVSGVCTSSASSVSHYASLLHSLARSVASAALNVVLELGDQPVAAYEVCIHYILLL